MAFGDRKAPLKRTGFKRKAPVNTARKARKPLPTRSKKRVKHMGTDRVPLVKQLVAEGVTCRVCPILAVGGIETHCAGVIQGLHERRKSSAGGSRVNPKNLVPSCNWGNTAGIEDAVGWHREFVEKHSGLVVREGHPEWEELGARQDKLA
jgi:hypothetical protein